jgi:hypothetical protein
VDNGARLLRWLLRLSLAITALLALTAGLLVVNNNVSLSGLSRVNFVKNLDRSLAASSGWIAEQFSSNASGELIATDLGLELVTNTALLHMLVDSSAISGDPRLQDVSSKIVATYRKGQPALTAKLVDPAIAGTPRNSTDLEEYQRWILHAISPAASPLSAAELADMFSADKFRMYDATHQLFALYISQVQRRDPRVEAFDGPIGGAHRRGSRPRFPRQRSLLAAYRFPIGRRPAGSGEAALG